MKLIEYKLSYEILFNYHCLMTSTQDKLYFHIMAVHNLIIVKPPTNQHVSSVCHRMEFCFAPHKSLSLLWSFCARCWFAFYEIQNVFDIFNIVGSTVCNAIDLCSCMCACTLVCYFSVCIVPMFRYFTALMNLPSTFSMHVNQLW